MASGYVEYSKIPRRNVLVGLSALAATAAASTPAYAAYSTSYFNRRIPDEAHEKMGELAGKGISSFSFTPKSGWVIATRDGPYFARNIPDECYKKLGKYVKAGRKINCIAFPPTGGNRWVICTNSVFFARNIPDECYERIKKFRKAGHEIKHVAFPPKGGNRWVVITNKSFYARGIDDECYQVMKNFARHGRKVTRVEFSWVNNGFVVIANDAYFARRIDDECFQKMQKFASQNREVHTIAFRPQKNGWSIYSRGRNPRRPKAPARQFESAFVSGRSKSSIWARMRALNVRGCTIAAIDNNKIAWTGGYGFLEKGKSGAAHPKSRFQAASLSKPVAAMGVLRLLEETSGLALNSDVRSRLNWSLNSRSCINPSNAPTVDLLLRHRGGVIGRGSTSPISSCSNFSSGGGGFGGYGPNTTVPTLLQVLNGQGNSPLIEISNNPGQYFYSGHGYMVLQRLVEQVSGQGFAAYMRSRILSPLGMTNSRFNMAIPQSWIDDKQIAAGHKKNGDVIPGKRNTYPESAAAGLYTSVVDLAKLLIWVNRRFTGATTNGPLTQASIQTLLSGRGFFVGGNGDKFNYSHGGANYGFRCTITGYPNRGAGYVIMTNSDDDTLLNEAVAAVKSVYGW